MASPIYGAPVCARKTPSPNHAIPPIAFPNSALRTAAAALPDVPPLVTPADEVALLAALGDHGIAGLDDLVAAIPGHPSPLSAIFALVDAGRLAVDLDAPFEAAIPVWRPAR